MNKFTLLKKTVFILNHKAKYNSVQHLGDMTKTKLCRKFENKGISKNISIKAKNSQWGTVQSAYIALYIASTIKMMIKNKLPKKAGVEVLPDKNADETRNGPAQKGRHLLNLVW